jgi:hypothetical protein
VVLVLAADTRGTLSRPYRLSTSMIAPAMTKATPT